MKIYVTLAALIAASTAMASDDMAPSSDKQPTSSVGSKGPWDIALGLQVRHRPDYLGSDEKSTHLLPMFRISYASSFGKFRLSTLPGTEAPMLSYSPFETTNAMLGIGLGVDPGRSETDAESFMPGSTRLNGMGRVSSTGVVALFGSYRISDVTVHGMYRAAIDSDKGHGGQLGNLHITYALPLRGPLSASIGVGATWASKKYMQNIFGVTAQQSINTGFGVYSPSSGMRDYSVGLDARYMLNRSVSLHGGVGVMRLAGDATDSPIVQKETQPRIYVGAMYHW